jgi:hypothetical protein
MERGIVILNEVKDLTRVLRAPSTLLAGWALSEHREQSEKSVKTIGLLVNRLNTRPQL